MWRATSTRRYFKGFGVREMTQGTMTAPELAPGADSAVTAAAPLAAYGAVRVPHRAGATAGRGLHSPTFQLNLNHFGQTSTCPPV
jgi:hypothetical protein